MVQASDLLSDKNIMPVSRWHLLGCVAKIFKPIKIDHRIVATKAFTGKKGVSFIRFTLLRFSNMHHFDELKNFCNTTLMNAFLASISLH